MKANITLFRKDLNKYCELFPIEKIDLYCFRTSVVTLNEIEQAEMILFVDKDDKKKILKDRYH